MQGPFRFSLDFPFSALCLGPSTSGKSQFIHNFLRQLPEKVRFSEPLTASQPLHILYFTRYVQAPLQQLSQDLNYPHLLKPMENCVPTHQDLLTWRKDIRPRLIILDDMIEVLEDSILRQFYVNGRHLNLAIITVSQTIFHPRDGWRAASLNANIIILFNFPRSLLHIKLLFRQIATGPSLHRLLELFENVSRKPYGYVLLWLTPKPPALGLRGWTNFLGENGHPPVAIKF